MLIVFIRFSGGDLGWYEQRRAGYIGAGHVCSLYSKAGTTGDANYSNAVTSSIKLVLVLSTTYRPL